MKLSEKSNVVYIEISTDRIREALSNMVKYKGSGTFLVNEDSGHLIAYGADEDFMARLADTGRNGGIYKYQPG